MNHGLVSLRFSLSRKTPKHCRCFIFRGFHKHMSQPEGWLNALHYNNDELFVRAAFRFVVFNLVRLSRLDGIFVGNLLVGHLGLLQHSIHDLLFQHNRLDFGKLLLVLHVPVHHLLRLLIGGGQVFDHGTYTIAVRLDVVLLDDFSNDQTEGYTALGLFFEQFCRQLARVDIGTTELLNSLLAQTIDLAADQRLGHVDFVGLQQTVHDLILGLGLDRLAQLALHVLAHFGAEAFDAAFFNAETSEELVIQLGQLGSSHFVDDDFELGRLVGQIQVLVVLREGDADSASLTSLGADQAVFEARDHAAGAQYQLGVAGGTALEGFAIDATGEIDGQLVAVFGSAFHSGVAGVLLAQDFQHVFQIGVGHFGIDALDFDVGEIAQSHFGVYLEGGDVFEALAFVQRLGLNARRAGGVQFFLNDGFIKGRLNHFTDDFLTCRCTKALANHAHRHLARTETINTCTASGLLQALVDFVFDALGRDANTHAALKAGDGFNRNLHVESSLNRQ